MKHKLSFFIPLFLLLLLVFPARAQAGETGSCGDSVYWEISDDHETLTIYGTGAMKDGAFSMFYEPTTVIVKSGVTYIGAWSFSYMGSLKTLIIEDTVTEIGDAAFVDCDSLSSIQLPQSQLSIGYLAFSHCASLSYISLPSTIKEINAGAFYDCYNLRSLRIPQGVSAVGYGIVSPHDTTLYYEGDVQQWNAVANMAVEACGTIVFLGGGMDGEYSIPASTYSLMDYAEAEYAPNDSPILLYYKDGSPCNGTIGWGSNLRFIHEGVISKNCFYALEEYGYGLFGNDGYPIRTPGWYTMHSDHYCAYNQEYVIDTDGSLYSGWKQKNGRWYYFNPETFSMLKDAPANIDDRCYLFDVDGAWVTAPGWHDIWYGSCLVGEDGYLKTGWQMRGGSWYYLMPHIGVTASRLQLIDRHFYYFDEENFIMQTGVVELGSWVYDAASDDYIYKTTSYTFGSDGAMVLTPGWFTYDSDTYYVEADGSFAAGWKQIGGKWYYFWTPEEDPNIACRMIADDTHLINGKLYSFDENGVMHSNCTVEDYYGGYRHFGADGAAWSGWKQVDGDWYYYDPENYFMVENSSRVIDGKTYLFDEDGKWVRNGLFYADYDYYLAGPDGTLKSGWQMVDGKWYYFDPIYYFAYYGFHAIDGHIYYFDHNRVMLTGKQTVEEGYGFVDNVYTTFFSERDFGTNGALILSPGWQKVDDEWYYVNADGTLKKGWLNDGGKWYYLRPDTPDYERPYTMTTFIDRIDGTWYFFDNGVMAANTWLDLTGEFNSSEPIILYFTANGSMANGWKNIDGKWYYFRSKEEGAPAEACTGMTLIDGEWYYLDPDNGYSMTTGWKQIAGKWHYFASSGAMAVGWKQISGTWYYFDESGSMQTGWKQISTSWYYFGSDGSMASGWKQIDGTWYYFGNTMTTGWKQIDGSWYYFGSDGAMKSGWQQIGSDWYYFGNTMTTGWKQISGTWYYFASNGTMTTGWKQISGTWYYFKASGAMAASETLDIGGTSYSFAASGAWIQ